MKNFISVHDVSNIDNLVKKALDYKGDPLKHSQLGKNRRIGLLFRALSFYDARRWGVIDPVASGGGRKAAIALSRTGVINTNATIEYNYLDYWDVPDNELAYNPAADGSAPTKNPK